MSSDCGMIFRLGRIAKLSPNLSRLGWIQSALVETVAWLPDFFRLCSFTYWWPYDRFLNITLSFCCFWLTNVLLECILSCLRALLILSKYHLFFVWGCCLYCQSTVLSCVRMLFVLSKYCLDALEGYINRRCVSNMLFQSTKFWGSLLQSYQHSEGVSRYVLSKYQHLLRESRQSLSPGVSKYAC